MSLLNEFKNDCPLTIKNLEKWLKTILTEVDNLTTLTLDFDVLSTISNLSRGASLNSTLGITTFNLIFDYIKDGLTIKAINDNTTITIINGSVSEIASDNFKSVEVTYYHNNELVTLTITTFGNDVFLDNVNKREV